MNGSRPRPRPGSMPHATPGIASPPPVSGSDRWAAWQRNDGGCWVHLTRAPRVPTPAGIRTNWSVRRRRSGRSSLSCRKASASVAKLSKTPSNSAERLKTQPRPRRSGWHPCCGRQQTAAKEWRGWRVRLAPPVRELSRRRRNWGACALRSLMWGSAAARRRGISLRWSRRWPEQRRARKAWTLTMRKRMVSWRRFWRNWKDLSARSARPNGSGIPCRPAGTPSGWASNAAMVRGYCSTPVLTASWDR